MAGGQDAEICLADWPYFCILRLDRTQGSKKNLSIETDDFEYAPFSQCGGLGKARNYLRK